MGHLGDERASREEKTLVVQVFANLILLCRAHVAERVSAALFYELPKYTLTLFPYLPG